MKLARKQNKIGFTLIETMVAIGILSLAATAPMVIAQKGIASAIYARDQITAFYLAEEAIEYVRNVRDTNKLKGDAWLKDLNPCEGPSSKRCSLDVFSDNLFNCPKGSNGEEDIWCTPITYNPTYGYGQSNSTGWTNTKFAREIIMDETVTNREALITVVITWQSNVFSGPRKFSVSTYLYNF